MKPGRNLRWLKEEDLPGLVELCREHAAFERAKWEEKDRLPALRRLFLEPGGAHCWVIETPEGLAGFATAGRELTTWDAAFYLHLDCLFLRQAYRGQGLGKALLQEVAQAALEMGAVNLQWQTPLWNEDAARFYRRLGAVSLEKFRFTLDRESCAKLCSSRDLYLSKAPSSSQDKLTSTNSSAPS